jgi:hypothetical protein
VQSALRSHHDPAVVPLAEAEVVWVGCNVDRVDARLRDPLGVEHHVVAMVRERRTEIVSVFRQPAAVPASRGLVVIVNGPSGSGKSTLMEAIARLDPVPWVVLDEPVIGTVDPAFLLWPDRTEALHRGVLDAIAALARAGVRVALSAGGRSQADLAAGLVGVPTLSVGLDCELATLTDRGHGRRRPLGWPGRAVRRRQRGLDLRSPLRHDVRPTGGRARGKGPRGRGRARPSGVRPRASRSHWSRAATSREPEGELPQSGRWALFGQRHRWWW